MDQFTTTEGGVDGEVVMEGAITEVMEAVSGVADLEVVDTAVDTEEVMVEVIMERKERGVEDGEDGNHGLNILITPNKFSTTTLQLSTSEDHQRSSNTKAGVGDMVEVITEVTTEDGVAGNQ